MNQTTSLRGRSLGAALFLFVLLCLGPGAVRAQQDNPGKYGHVSGAIQLDATYYFRDTTIGSPEVPERFLNNAFANVNYTLGGFQAGIRFEAYLNPLLGIDPRYQGQGIANRFISYQHERIKVTVGNFYEQFGSGMVLRAYWQPLLGFDNSIDGVLINAEPLKGLTVKALYGKQRQFFSLGAGIVRGGDVELDLNRLIAPLDTAKLRISVGGSFVSRYQQDQDPIYILPENVAAGAGRLNVQYGKWSLGTEYVYKVNDPSSVNSLIYRPGQALLITTSYATKGLGITLMAKRLDNMDFRSDRNATGNNLLLNFLPPNGKQHTWRLPTLYLYATQPRGEMGIQADILYTLPKGSKLGGPYGTTIQVNYSRVQGLDTTQTLTDFGYESPFLGVGKRLYYQDFNIEITRKLSKSLKLTLAYLNMVYDKDQILNLTGFGTLNINALIGEVFYKFNSKHAVRTEVQWMHTKGDFGSWVMGLVEYSLSPSWYFTLSNEYNYGNPDPAKRVNYYGANVAYSKGSLRVAFGYNRQRAGIICIGGVCRLLPASNGFTGSLSWTF